MTDEKTIDSLVVSKVLDKQDTLLKAYGEMCTTLGELRNQLSNIEKNTRGTEEALKNGIMTKISKCVEQSVNQLYWRFSGTIILIFGIFSVIVKVF